MRGYVGIIIYIFVCLIALIKGPVVIAPLAILHLFASILLLRERIQKNKEEKRKEKEKSCSFCKKPLFEGFAHIYSNSHPGQLEYKKICHRCIDSQMSY
ncbi:hypothetical protein M3202_19660 [Alkalihalobacillus oceani]|uniref:Uncharacterized protein n=1 Tax=Halalkalibacter oceani TaxID=1653776 RepID=A0A9X2DSR0_9BACI|nr:hypothetical protein [Halalkalibacter oceani]MCM3716264.1 hypothetical protein [Halalkalibacter oceani]